MAIAVELLPCTSASPLVLWRRGGGGSGTGTALYSIQGSIVTLQLPVLIGTSNSPLFFYSGLPIPIVPTRLTVCPLGPMVDNGVFLYGCYASLGTSQNISFYSSASQTQSWTVTGTKSCGFVTGLVQYQNTLVYSLV